jgi:multimeric flavodoxin WrbA
VIFGDTRTQQLFESMFLIRKLLKVICRIVIHDTPKIISKFPHRHMLFFIILKHATIPLGVRHMEKAKVLGIAGSPRENGNTAKLIEKALEGAASIGGIEIELYDMGGEEFHHCTGCFSCLKTGICKYKDSFQEFADKYMESDGIIWGSPIYHMSIPGSMKAALDRLGNSIVSYFLRKGEDFPRFNKVCGVLTVGATRYGGQDLVNNFMILSSLVMNGVVVSGDTILGNYIGAAAYTGSPGCVEVYPTVEEQMLHKDVSLKDTEGVTCAINLGKRVAEMTKIVTAGLSAMKDELPPEYFFKWEKLS